MSITDVQSDFNIAGGLSKGAARVALDPEIASEGGKVMPAGNGTVVILSNGDQVPFTPPPEKLVMPDLSNVKSLRHYFGQKAYQPYPAWLYHKSGEQKLVRNHKEAGDLGIVYRETTRDERDRYGIRHMWDWEEGCLWRPSPWVEAKFDPKSPGSSKNVIWSTPDPSIAQHDLVAKMIPAVAAAVAQSLQSNGPAAPASVNPKEWEEFLAFKAWQKTQEVVNVAAATALSSPPVETDQPIGEFPLDNALTPEQDRKLWEAEAERQGIKIDGRWSTERLKSEVQKKATAA